MSTATDTSITPANATVPAITLSTIPSTAPGTNPPSSHPKCSGGTKPKRHSRITAQSFTPVKPLNTEMFNGEGTKIQGRRRGVSVSSTEDPDYLPPPTKKH